MAHWGCPLHRTAHSNSQRYCTLRSSCCATGRSSTPSTSAQARTETGQRQASTRLPARSVQHAHAAHTLRPRLAHNLDRKSLVSNSSAATSMASGMKATGASWSTNKTTAAVNETAIDRRRSPSNRRAPSLLAGAPRARAAGYGRHRTGRAISFIMKKVRIQNDLIALLSRQNLIMTITCIISS